MPTSRRSTGRDVAAVANQFGTPAGIVFGVLGALVEAIPAIQKAAPSAAGPWLLALGVFAAALGQPTRAVRKRVGIYPEHAEGGDGATTTADGERVFATNTPGNAMPARRRLVGVRAQLDEALARLAVLEQAHAATPVAVDPPPSDGAPARAVAAGAWPDARPEDFTAVAPPPDGAPAPAPAAGTDPALADPAQFAELAQLLGSEVDARAAMAVPDGHTQRVATTLFAKLVAAADLRAAERAAAQVPAQVAAPSPPKRKASAKTPAKRPKPATAAKRPRAPRAGGEA